MRNIKLMSFGLVGILCVFTTIAQAAESKFGGWYLGMGLGATSMSIPYNKEFTDTIGITPNSLDIAHVIKSNNAATHLDIELTAGYSANFNNKYLAGLEGRINIKSTKAKISLNGGANIGGNQITRLEAVSTIKKLPISGTLLLKSGIFPSEQALLYGVIGTKISSFRNQSADSYRQNTPDAGIAAHSGSRTRTKLGMALGVGLETYFTSSATIGMDYLYVNYFKMPELVTLGAFSNIAGSSVAKIRSRASSHSIILKVKYYWN